jgi:hypothetical protein
MYDHGDEKARDNLIYFAMENLKLHEPCYLDYKQYAVLSQRLDLDINSTAYVSTPNSAYDATLNIANHIWVCVEIREGNERHCRFRTYLFRVGSFLTRRELSQFNLPTALSEILTGFSINLGDRGELLVAAFFTWARDTALDNRFWPVPGFCHHWLVKDLISSLFSEAKVGDTPSTCPSETNRRTLEEVSSTINMHFNHFIQAQEPKVKAHQDLIAFIAWGAAVLGANFQLGFDTVFLYLFGGTDLEEKNIDWLHHRPGQK